jgi:GH25 family lysozyme M1 (1,4-beta-N-acetylmuramidase)
MRIDALDLSHWNEVTNFTEVADAGVVGVIHKATEGHTYVDKTYAPRMRQALDAGLKWGSYHFLKHGNVAAQMKHYLKYAKAEPGARVCIDYEDPACTLSDLHEAVAAIAGIDDSLQIAIYTGHLLKEQLGDKHDRQLSRCSLWLAQYTAGEPSWPKGTWEHWSLWQFTDGDVGGSPREVPGVSSPMDCNEFNGNKQACAQWFGPVAADSDLVA